MYIGKHRALNARLILDSTLKSCFLFTTHCFSYSRTTKLDQALFLIVSKRHYVS